MMSATDEFVREYNRLGDLYRDCGIRAVWERHGRHKRIIDETLRRIAALSKRIDTSQGEHLKKEDRKELDRLVRVRGLAAFWCRVSMEFLWQHETEGFSPLFVGKGREELTSILSNSHERLTLLSATLGPGTPIALQYTWRERFELFDRECRRLHLRHSYKSPDSLKNSIQQFQKRGGG